LTFESFVEINKQMEKIDIPKLLEGTDLDWVSGYLEQRKGESTYVARIAYLTTDDVKEWIKTTSGHLVHKRLCELSARGVHYSTSFEPFDDETDRFYLLIHAPFT